MHIKKLLTFCALIALAISVQAQHYPAGIAGIKAGTLPGPGFTVEDDNSFYFAESYPGYGAFLAHGFSTFSYTQTPRLTWMSDWKILGANYGAGVRIPIEYKLDKYIYGNTSGEIIHQKSNFFGIGDVEIQPILLLWHLKHFDFSACYSFWAPTGDY